MTDDDKTELRAMLEPMVLDAVSRITSGVTLGIERYLRGQLVDMQGDLDAALDKLVSLDREIGEVKVISTQIRREQMKDVRRAEADHERAINADTEIAALKFRIGKLTERLDTLEKGTST